LTADSFFEESLALLLKAAGANEDVPARASVLAAPPVRRALPWN